MPFDAVLLAAVRCEIQDAAIGARVEKIHQPARDTVILHLRGRGGHHKLLITISPNQPRVHLTHTNVENPAQPPMFCMLLRKHLAGGRLLALSQPPMERMLDFTFDCTDEMGVNVQKHLIVELLGRAANLILTDADRRIIDCARRVDFEMSEARPVLPGLFYQNPPSQMRLLPTEVTSAQILQQIAALQEPKRMDKWLLEQFAGLSPLVCREIAYRSCGEVDADLHALDPEGRAAFAETAAQCFAQIKANHFTPCLLLQDQAPKDFSYLPILQYGSLYTRQSPTSFSQMLDEFYATRDLTERMRQRTQVIQKTIHNLAQRTARKLALQEQELLATKDRERLRQLGDIVTANIHSMSKGQLRLTAVDFYDPEMQEIEIPLSPLLSPQQNAAKYYKDYTKAKHAEKYLTQQLDIGRKELQYLQSVLDELSRAENEKDINEIRAELLEGGYLREKDQKKKMKQAPSKPMAFYSSDGFAIQVGRNNRQNDLLTTKMAMKYDLWFHTQKFHGSHVILLCNSTEPSETAIAEAAMLAAYFSEARQGQNVPVDYTIVKHVKKPNGAKPGMVIYDHYHTKYVTPDAQRVEALRAKL